MKKLIQKIRQLLGLSPQKQNTNENENDPKNKEEEQVKERLRDLGYL